MEDNWGLSNWWGSGYSEPSNSPELNWMSQSNYFDPASSPMLYESPTYSYSRPEFTMPTYQVQEPSWQSQLSSFFQPVSDAWSSSTRPGGFIDQGSRALGGLGMLLGLEEAIGRRGLQKEQLGLMKQQAARSNAAQDWALSRAKQQASAQDLLKEAEARRFGQKQQYKVAIDPSTSRLGFTDPTGAFSTGRPNVEPMRLAGGGLAAYARGTLVKGPGSGQADKIPALLSDGEYILDASTVSDIGDGSTEAGARELDEMVKRIRKEKRGGLTSLPRKAKNPKQYLKG